MELTGRRALVTGATGGLGQAIARALHGGGATSTSARSRSMPRSTPAATWSGVRVLTHGGSFTPLSANIPASLGCAAATFVAGGLGSDAGEFDLAAAERLAFGG